MPTTTSLDMGAAAPPDQYTRTIAAVGAGTHRQEPPNSRLVAAPDVPHGSATRGIAHRYAPGASGRGDGLLRGRPPPRSSRRREPPKEFLAMAELFNLTIVAAVRRAPVSGAV